MFSIGQIFLCALIGGAISFLTVVLYGRSQQLGGSAPAALAMRLGIVVFLSIVLWRAAGNTPSLNDDPMPFVSPNDVLSPVVTYIAVGLYGAAAGQESARGWSTVRALLTLVSLVVNVVTI